VLVAGEAAPVEGFTEVVDEAEAAVAPRAEQLGVRGGVGQPEVDAVVAADVRLVQFVGGEVDAEALVRALPVDLVT